MGLDVGELIERALRDGACMRIRNSSYRKSGLALGTIIGELAKQGMDKLTFLMPETLSSLGMWLEQLLAERTGKEGKGILPVAGELPAIIHLR